MDILKALIQLANKLDQKGLYKEAKELDEIVKEALEPTYEASPPGFRDTFHQQPIGYQETPSEMAGRQMEEFKQKHQQGKGGAGTSKDPNALAFQKQYNAIWDQLKNLGLRTRQSFGPRLQEDARRGPKTMRAERMFPRLQAILKNELKDQQTGKPGTTEQSEGRGPWDNYVGEKGTEGEGAFPVSGPWTPEGTYPVETGEIR